MAEKRRRLQRNKKQNQKLLESSIQDVKIEDSAIVGAFSIDRNGNFKNDMSALKYLKQKYWKTPQNVNFDLKEIYKNMTIKGSDPNTHNYLDRLNNLTRFIQNNSENFIKNSKIDADFVCFRGALRHVLASFYCHQGWIIEAVKLKGTIYLALITDCILEPIDYLTIFENCIVTSDPKRESVDDLESSDSEFCVVMSREIDNLKILFGMECDAVVSEVPIKSLDDLRNSKLIEIKSRLDKSRHYKAYFRDYKKLHWWCQSSIASIDTIYLGKRNSDDIVKTIEEIDVNSLDEPEKSHKFWNKNVCLSRLSEFLRNVKKDMEDIDDPRTVFRYEWKETFTIGRINFQCFQIFLKIENFLTKISFHL
ncbi:decapping and exoribonuclease protein Rai1-like [Chironomus tepperi]|uniref:decapping and exoribonuclease protein Rai1-like n=1 Tax=Chironomus tepperi TaxID=113505 RepID=UPI00391EF4AF